MKAAILREFKAPLSIEEVAPPKPDANEVLLEVEACGVCHSDLHVADGDWPQIVPITKRPLILGHEIVGRVVEKGSAVEALRLGDRVGVPWVHWTCGAVRTVPRRQRKPLRQPKNYRRHRGWRLRGVCESSRDSRAQDS